MKQVIPNNMKQVITFILCFAAFTASAQLRDTLYSQLTDTLYYKNGDKRPCKIASMHINDLAVFFVDSATKTAKLQTVPTTILDSCYLMSPSNYDMTTSSPPKTGNNLIASGVMTLVGSAAIIVGSQLDKFKEGAIIGAVASLISTATLINAGVVSNSKEPPPPPPPKLNHIIVY